jgi:chromosome segregation ATPase
MGLLDDLFRKDSLNQLKKQVTEKNEAIARAESEIAEKTINLTNLETRLTALNATISDRQTAIESLKSALDKSQTENRRKTLEIEKLRAFALDQNTQADNQILILKNSLAKASAETEAATIARKSIEKSWHEAQESYDAKDRLLQEREEKYTEKLEKLLINRQRFQQTSAEFHSRLQNWKQNVEPQLQKYEQHLSLDSRQLRIQEAMSRLEELRASITAREDDLVRRDCTDKALTSREAKVSAWNKTLTNQQDVLEKKLEEVRRKKIEQDERTLKLENWARELFAFRNRVNQLDNEIIALAKQKKDFESNEAIGQSQNSERLADLQRKQSTLKALENRIGEREEYLNAREITINQAGSHIISLKQDNVSLRRELGEITARAENLEASNREYLSKTSRLTRKNELLQANYAAMNERLKSTTGTNRFNSSLANVKVLSWLLESGNPDAAKIANGWLGSTGT